MDNSCKHAKRDFAKTPGLRAVLRSGWLGAQVLVHEALPNWGGHGGLSIPLIHLKPPLLLHNPQTLPTPSHNRFFTELKTDTSASNQRQHLDTGCMHMTKTSPSLQLHASCAYYAISCGQVGVQLQYLMPWFELHWLCFRLWQLARGGGGLQALSAADSGQRLRAVACQRGSRC